MITDISGTDRARHPEGNHPDAQLEAASWISEALGTRYGIHARHRHVLPAGGGKAGVMVHLFDPRRPGADKFCAAPGKSIAGFCIEGWTDKASCLAALAAKMRKLSRQ
jgi:hypothetical protein